MTLEILHLFFDPICPACLRPVKNIGVFCTACANAQQTLVPPYCRVCGIPIPHEGYCGSCLEAPPPFTAAFSALPYEGPVAHAIRRGKYGPVPWIFSRLGQLLVPLLQAAGPGWVVPVPCTPSAWKTRGFSPVMQLCQSACRELGKPWKVLDALTRCDGKTPQAFLHGKQRLHLSGSEFSLRCDVSGKRILLIDDVMTTGTTVRTVAKKFANAADVIVITLCRTL